jgi:predicted DCC family thiol-disulfide oxidoreductase YuxK
MISVNTEMTECMKGWVCYDAECSFCSRLAARAEHLLTSRGFHLAPLQAGWVRDRLGWKEGEPLTGMKLITADGRVIGGADAAIRLAGLIWWAWPLFAFSRLPGAKAALRAIYRQVAKNRYCLGRARSLTAKSEKRHHHSTSSFYDLSE